MYKDNQDHIEDAIEAFETSLERTPNRRNALNGVEEAAAAFEGAL